MRRDNITSSINREKFSFVGRATCYDCFRPLNQCLCNVIAPFTAHFNTIILQHPHERKKYYSTVKLLSKAIRNLCILRGIDFNEEPLFSNQSLQNTYLLYPRSDAIDCEELLLDSDSTVIILDGTWREASKIIFNNPFLKRLPCISFKNELASNYRIRKQPKSGYLSTLESLAYLLKKNAKVSGCEALLGTYDTLFDGFRLMVEQQLSYWPQRSNSIGCQSNRF